MKKIPIYNIMKYIFSYGEIKLNKNVKYKTWQQKFLWFLNFYYVKEKGEQLFNEDFYAFNYGPISRTILDLQYYENKNVFLYHNLEEALEVEIDQDKNLFPESTVEIIKSEQEIKEQFIKEFEEESEKGFKWELFQKVFQKCQYKTPGKLVSLSHNQFLWKKKIDLSTVEEKRITLEQIKEEETDPLGFYGEENE